MSEVLLYQGAEAKVFSCIYNDHEAIVKERLSKSYRIRELDLKINKQRITQESRCMEKCRKAGIRVPMFVFSHSKFLTVSQLLFFSFRLFFTDLSSSRIYMEKIIGSTLRDFLHHEQGFCSTACFIPFIAVNELLQNRTQCVGKL